MATFMEKVQPLWDEGKFVCVGLDSDMNHRDFPKVVQTHQYVLRYDDLDAEQRRQLSFNCWIIDATKNLVMAYKPNLAFYRGAKGKRVLAATIKYIRKVAPKVLVILDAKQGDIGNTNDGYVAEDFEYYDADAVTVFPLLGMVAMKPFLDRADKGIIVLCHTSNEGAEELQGVECRPWRNNDDGRFYATMKEFYRENGEDATGNLEQVSMPFFHFVAYRVAQAWNRNGNCAIVFGATYADAFADVRIIIEGMAALIPGIGAQGGELEATVLAGRSSSNQGIIINSSRGIIFAYATVKDEDGERKYTPEQFAEAARDETQKLHDAVTVVLKA